MFEWLLFAAAEAHLPEGRRTVTSPSPPPELLEFLGEWGDERDAVLLDGPDDAPDAVSKSPKATAQPPRHPDRPPEADDADPLSR